MLLKQAGTHQRLLDGVVAMDGGGQGAAQLVHQVALTRQVLQSAAQQAKQRELRTPHTHTCTSRAGTTCLPKGASSNETEEPKEPTMMLS